MTPAATVSLRPNEEGFFSISPLMIFPKVMGKFSVFLRQGGEYVLYTSAEETFTERHKRTLYQNGIRDVFIRLEHKERYARYVEQNLGEILLDEALPLRERAGVFYKASTQALEEIFDSHLQYSIDEKAFARIQRFVEHAVKFLCVENALKAVAEFIAHDYKTYTHCINVFVYTVMLLQSYGLDEESVIRCGLGAMLHDVGKTRIPKAILDKPGRLNPEERRVINRHPTLGLAACTLMSLSQEAMNIILFHHEKVDGSGYPAGLLKDEIPLPVRCVTIADIYDALTTDRPYAKAKSAFEVLEMMRSDMGNEIDLDVFKRFIMLLSGADLINK